MMSLAALLAVPVPSHAHHGWSEYGDSAAGTPAAAKLHAAASLSIWIGVITCGRLLAYL